MKLYIIAVLLMAGRPSLAAKLGDSNTPVAIVSQLTDMRPDGSYDFSYETENGIKVQESGVQKQIGATPEESGTVSKGSYSYTSPEGQLITVNWIADENGFQATGAHLPTPPPMPAHVVKLLADLKAAGKL